jgi:hypothetical protein
MTITLVAVAITTKECETDGEMQHTQERLEIHTKL